jgi:two-component system, NtrC family, nitrogen regulation response regulator NtrX
MERILVVDDEQGVRESLLAILRDEGFVAEAVATGEECLAQLKTQSYDAVLLDIWLPRMDGLEVLQSLGTESGGPVVVIISGHGSIETAVHATKLGAFDFVEKPLSLEKILLVVRNALKQHKLETQNLRLRREMVGQVRLIGQSLPLRRLREEIDAAAPSDGRVLIRGENGTGKELVARAIHAGSRRSEESFVEINCAAIPEELIESEMFGHVRGAFTGAVEGKQGKFELANGGTLFLDEVADMSDRTQAKLLRVLEEGTFEPVGGSTTTQVDVRVLAATNQDLEERIRGGRFREDLFFRLNVIPLVVPPLRERLGDVPLLVEHFLQEIRGRHGRGPGSLAPDAMEALQAYAWPGNVRELRNLVERIVIMVQKEVVERSDLPGSMRGADPGEDPFSPGRTLRDGREIFERQFILRRLAEHGHNITRTAEALGLERSHLHRKIKALGLD